MARLARARSWEPALRAMWGGGTVSALDPTAARECAPSFTGGAAVDLPDVVTRHITYGLMFTRPTDRVAPLLEGTLACAASGKAMTAVGEGLRDLVSPDWTEMPEAFKQVCQLYTLGNDASDKRRYKIGIWYVVDSQKHSLPINHEALRETAARNPATDVEAARIEWTDNPASDLRIITGLTIRELAEACRVQPRTYMNWLRGEPMSPENETRILRLRYLLTVLAESMRSAGLRLWLRSPHRKYRQTPLHLLSQGDDRVVEELAERLEQSAVS